jgi:hypothetical protein
MTAIPLSFKIAFRAGSQVTDEEFARFERFHPRAAGLSNLDYAKQLEALGLGLHIGAREAVEDFPRYKMLLDQARQDGIPLIVTTGTVGSGVPDPTPDANEATKMAALARARGVAPTGAAPAEATPANPTTT